MARPIGDLAHAVNLSDKHLQAIGEVAVRWAELEQNIKEIVSDLANMRHSSALAVTAHINESSLVNIARSLVDLLVAGPEPQLAQDIEDHLNYVIGQVYPKRNDMVHSVFGYCPDGKTEILPVRARGKLKFGPRKAFSADDIFSIAKEIYEANEKLHGYVVRLQDLIPTWHHIKK
jgi:hypothetical protein